MNKENFENKEREISLEEQVKKVKGEIIYLINSLTVIVKDFNRLDNIAEDLKKEPTYAETLKDEINHTIERMLKLKSDLEILKAEMNKNK